MSCKNEKKLTYTEVTDKDIYRIIKILINEMPPKLKLDKTENLYIIDELETSNIDLPNFKLSNYFTKEDINSFNEQFSKRQHFKLNKDSIKPIRLLSKKIIDSFYDSKNKKSNRGQFIENYTKKIW